MAGAEFLAEGGYDRHVRKLRGTLAAQSERYRDAIAGSFPEGTRMSRPQGGFSVWVELPVSAGGKCAVDLQIRALDQGIAIAPGPIVSARQRFGHCFRVSTGHRGSSARSARSGNWPASSVRGSEADSRKKMHASEIFGRREETALGQAQKQRGNRRRARAHP